jgi:hypothetical protein
MGFPGFSECWHDMCIDPEYDEPQGETPMKLRSGWIILVGLACGLLSVSASAATITLDRHGWSNGHIQGSIDGVRKVDVLAGEFRFNVTGQHDLELDMPGKDGEILAFCIDVKVNLLDRGNYSVVGIGESGLEPEAQGLLGKLYDHHYAAIKGKNDSAAFQLAVWEIIYDWNADALKLKNPNQGEFHASSFQGARETAQKWLKDLADKPASGAYALSVLDPVGPKANQRLITAQRIPEALGGAPKQVPEPTTLALLGLGISGLMWVRRRQPSKWGQIYFSSHAGK